MEVVGGTLWILNNIFWVVAHGDASTKLDADEFYQILF